MFIRGQSHGHGLGPFTTRNRRRIEGRPCWCRCDRSRHRLGCRRCGRLRPATEPTRRVRHDETFRRGTRGSSHPRSGWPAPQGKGLPKREGRPATVALRQSYLASFPGGPTAEEQNPHGNRGTRSVSGRALRARTPSGRGPKVHNRGPSRATQRTLTEGAFAGRIVPRRWQPATHQKLLLPLLQGSTGPTHLRKFPKRLVDRPVPARLGRCRNLLVGF
jgi:hypothetical protein